MAIIESLAAFILSLFCLSGCFSINRKFLEQEEEIHRLENACPPQYEEDPAPPYHENYCPNDGETDESTPILPQPIDQPPN